MGAILWLNFCEVVPNPNLQGLFCRVLFPHNIMKGLPTFGEQVPLEWLLNRDQIIGEFCYKGPVRTVIPKGSHQSNEFLLMFPVWLKEFCPGFFFGKPDLFFYPLFEFQQGFFRSNSVFKDPLPEF